MTEFVWQADGTGFLNIEGKQIEYACWGDAPGDKPAIIMLHEGLGCIALWRDFPERLAKQTGLSVFAYSRFGYGQSDPAELPRPLDYMTREAVDVLPQVLDAVGMHKCILLGHSDGATIAAIYAGSVEDHRVRGVVVMAPHFFAEEDGLRSIAEARQSYETSGLKDKLAKYHRDPDNAFYGWNDAWLDPGFKDWNVTEVIDYLRVPVLAIQGEGDQYGSAEQVYEIERRSYAPVEVQIMKDTLHSPHLEKTDETTALIADFCERLQQIETA